MTGYELLPYSKGFEVEQARIGIQAALEWAWPYAYDQDDLRSLHSRPDFDPGLSLYCFQDGQLVGYMTSQLSQASPGQPASAQFDFPRLLPGHEQAAELLLIRMLEVLRGRGIHLLRGRVSTMCPGDILLAEQAGFTFKEWGYKVYYSYAMAQGPLAATDKPAEEINPARDLQACSLLASRWYKSPPEACRIRLEDFHARGFISHAGVRRRGKLVGSCLAAPNVLRPSTAANYYISTPDDASLRALLERVIGGCIKSGAANLIADLIHEHRVYEAVYQELGFHRVAEWARLELELD